MSNILTPTESKSFSILSPKILITGSTGRLGKELKKVFPDAVCPAKKQLDVEKYTCTVKDEFDIVIHCAAMTGVEQCEKEKARAFTINAGGTFWVKYCFPQAKIIYISTPCVFDGSKSHNEGDQPCPVNWYGRTKAMGEFYADIVIRTNFVTRGKWEYPKAFADRHGTYLYADQVARAIKEVIDSRRFYPVLHICGDKEMSMYELALKTTPTVMPITLDEYKGVELTKNMCLSSKLWKHYHLGDTK